MVLGVLAVQVVLWFFRLVQSIQTILLWFDDSLSFKIFSFIMNYYKMAREEMIGSSRVKASFKKIISEC